MIEMLYYIVAIMMYFYRLKRYQKSIEDKKIHLDGLVWDRVKDYLIGDNSRRYWMKLVYDAYNHNRRVCGATHPLVYKQDRRAVEVNLYCVVLYYSDGQVDEDTLMPFRKEMKWRESRLTKSREQRYENNITSPRRMFKAIKEDGEWGDSINLSPIE